MDGIYLVFDYFKEAFHINKRNKRLYTPQLILIAIKLLMIIAVGLRIYTWIGNFDVSTFSDYRKLLHFFLAYGIKIILALILYSLVSVFMDSGLYNMYKKCVLYDSVQEGDFSEGVKKYFLRFLLGSIVIGILYTVASVIIAIIGLITLGLGSSIILLLATIFLSMWKVSIVFDDTDVFTAISNSFKFAKDNFLAISFLQIVHLAFTNMRSGGSGFNYNSFNSLGNNSNNSLNSTNPFPYQSKGILDSTQVIDQGIKLAKTVVAILIPVITIAALSAYIIKMIFEVFFSLTLFVAYKNKFNAYNPNREVL
ncbi:MAG: hypothetical protein Q8936_10445 [Bacillota bacterium]|nr:hypothetical protein [Bacillota bacterium]